MISSWINDILWFNKSRNLHYRVRFQMELKKIHNHIKFQDGEWYFLDNEVEFEIILKKQNAFVRTTKTNCPKKD